MISNLFLKKNVLKKINGQTINDSFQRFFSTSGNLYTWGRTTSSLGYKLPQQIQEQQIPKKVEFFDGNVAKCSLGVNHSAVISDKGELYTWGQGKNGALGHNDGHTNHVQPKLVEFFSKNNLKVMDIALGDNHSIALTSDGDVWSWGYGGRLTNFFVNIFLEARGALGHGDKLHRFTPTPIEFLRNLPPTQNITSGYNFAIAQIGDDLYNWGRGDYGVHGDGANTTYTIPKKNEFFGNFYNDKDEIIKVVKLKTANNFSVALMTDGCLYGWGSNESGQIGIKNEIGVEMYETAQFPTQIVNDQFKDQKIVDFEIGEDTMIVLTDQNEVHWAGMRLAYQPEKMKLPENVGKIKLVTCCYRALAVVTENNDIYMRNSYLKQQSENIDTGILYSNNDCFEGKEIIGMGGQYRNRYAIIKK